MIFLLLFIVGCQSSPVSQTSEYSIGSQAVIKPAEPSIKSPSNNASAYSYNNPNNNSRSDTAHESDELLVNTENGQVRGRAIVLNEHFKEINPLNATAMRQARKIYRLNAWLGIPYAEKPLGDLRFKRPVSVKSWSPRVINATQLPNSCYQLPDTVINNFTGVEMWNANTKVL